MLFETRKFELMTEKQTKNRPHIVVFSGAGMSAESGIKTFRDNGGLWENHQVSEVATPEAWNKDPELVLKFYNMRRKQLLEAKPNSAHRAVFELEKHYRVTVVTQNIDNLHERAGSTNVLHLHGELMKVESEKYPNLIYELKKDKVELGDLCEKGFQLRPHVVWFGEAVPNMEIAYKIASKAAIFIVIGTSLNVYPASGIINYVNSSANCFLIDPNMPSELLPENWTILNTTAGKGMEILSKKLMSS